MNIFKRMLTSVTPDTYTRISQDTVKINGDEYIKVLPPPALDKQSDIFRLALIEKGLRPRGDFRLAKSWVSTFGNDQHMIWVQVHPQGDIAGVYTEINSNDMDTILNKIFEPDKNKERARKLLDLQLEYRLPVEGSIELNETTSNELRKDIKTAVNYLRK